MKKLLVLLVFIIGLMSINALETETERWCIDEGRRCRRWWHKRCCHPYRCIHGRCRKPWWWDNDNDNHD